MSDSLPAADDKIPCRLMFLEGLQKTHFWQNLASTLQPGWTVEDLSQWMVDAHVCDEWFKEVVLHTACRWAVITAENPGMKISTDSGTCFYDPVVNEQRFSIPASPIQIDEEWQFVNGKAESVERWEERLRKSFEAQLRDRVRYWKFVRGKDREAQRRHANWTARRFTGESFNKIALDAIGAKELPNSTQPNVAVSKAVELNLVGVAEKGFDIVKAHSRGYLRFDIAHFDNTEPAGTMHGPVAGSEDQKTRQLLFRIFTPSFNQMFQWNTRRIPLALVDEVLRGELKFAPVFNGELIPVPPDQVFMLHQASKSQWDDSAGMIQLFNAADGLAKLSRH